MTSASLVKNPTKLSEKKIKEYTHHRHYEHGYFICFITMATSAIPTIICRRISITTGQARINTCLRIVLNLKIS
jgi:hypothetical protein